MLRAETLQTLFITSCFLLLRGDAFMFRQTFKRLLLLSAAAATLLFLLSFFKRVTQSSLPSLRLILKSHFISAILNPALM